MEPFSLIALATAAGFVFKRMSRASADNSAKTTYLLPRRSKISPGKIQKVGTGVDIDEIEELPEYLFVKKLIDASFPIIFVTGGAGTGKSTFINWLMLHYPGNVLLAAPTAISATNIEGKTLHSLFQLPLQWIRQKDIKSAHHRTDIKKAKLLIIDEISMVNANQLDGVSAFLRLNRGVNKPFGGLPLILVGDLFQLPPIVKQGLRELYDNFYDGKTKFYAARSLTKSSTTYYAVELSKTFRQSDSAFVNVLSDIREGRNLENALRLINSSCTITKTPPEGAVWLAPRRVEVDKANRAGLMNLASRMYRFEGKTDGNYHTGKDHFPSPMTVYLKVGAQVMFTQNDPMKQWVNGTVGVVREISNKIVVETQPHGTLVKVAKAKWINFSYRWNNKTKKIEKQEVGSYYQYPIIPAWAITIHKSQGKTIEKVHLDLGRGAFAFGQTYVALSRCRELKGLTLSRPLNVSDIRVDSDSQDFNDHLHDLIEKLPQDKMLRAIEAEDA